jgi:hypothetical protein
MCDYYVSNKNFKRGWVWWSMPIIPAFGRLRQEDPEFKTRMGYVVRPCLKKTKPKPKNLKMSIISTLTPVSSMLTGRL